MTTKIPTFLQKILALSTPVIGLFLGVHEATNACFSLMYRRFVSRIRLFTIMGIGFLLMTVALLVLELSVMMFASLR